MFTRLKHTGIVICLAAQVSGCSTVGPALTPSQANVNSACCKNAAEIPSFGQLKAVNSISLNPKAAHFDFGSGLAPAIAFEIPTGFDGADVELRSQHQDGLGFAGRTQYVPAANVIFLDASGNVVPSTLGKPTGKRVGSAFKPLRVVRTVVIPPTARILVVSTEPKEVGVSETIPAETPGFLMPVGSAFINYTAGIVPYKYEGTYYGDVEVVLLGQGTKRQ